MYQILKYLKVQGAKVYLATPLHQTGQNDIASWQIGFTGTMIAHLRGTNTTWVVLGLVSYLETKEEYKIKLE